MGDDGTPQFGCRAPNCGDDDTSSAMGRVEMREDIVEGVWYDPSRILWEKESGSAKLRLYKCARADGYILIHEGIYHRLLAEWRRGRRWPIYQICDSISEIPLTRLGLTYDDIDIITGIVMGQPAMA